MGWKQALETSGSCGEECHWPSCDLSGAALAKTWLCGISDCLVVWWGVAGMAGMGVVLFVSHFKVRDTNTDAIAENALLYALE
jgi:hypothetical protein